MAGGCFGGAVVSTEFDDFIKSLDGDRPPDGLTIPLQGLWHAARGEWNAAHLLVQNLEGIEAAWVHAHLHRIEGDTDNARYWYTRARRDMPVVPIEMERTTIIRVLLGKNGDR